MGGLRTLGRVDNGLPQAVCLSQGSFLSCLACVPFFLAVLRKWGSPTTPGALPSRLQASFSPRPRPGVFAEGSPLGLSFGPPGAEFPSVSPLAFSGLLGIRNVKGLGAGRLVPVICSWLTQQFSLSGEIAVAGEARDMSPGRG